MLKHTAIIICVVVFAFGITEILARLARWCSAKSWAGFHYCVTPAVVIRPEFLENGTRGMCANRHMTVFMVGTSEVTVVVRDTTKPDGYSREELVTMLETIRREETIQQWTVPEPQ